MIKVLGTDGVEYGPATLEELQQWIREGRLNQASMGKRETDSDWVPLGQFPELAAAFATAPQRAPEFVAPFSPPAHAAGNRDAAQAAVALPGMFMMIIGGLGILWNLGQVIFALVRGPEANPLFRTFEQQSVQISKAAFMVGLVVALMLSMVWAGVVVFAGAKLRNLESRGLVMTAAILMLIPCLGNSFPVCLLSLPLGIWTLVVINRVEVKESFT